MSEMYFETGVIYRFNENGDIETDEYLHSDSATLLPRSDYLPGRYNSSVTHFFNELNAGLTQLGWQPLCGYSNQDHYDGPCMHPSERINPDTLIRQLKPYQEFVILDVNFTKPENISIDEEGVVTCAEVDEDDIDQSWIILFRDQSFEPTTTPESQQGLYGPRGWTDCEEMNLFLSDERSRSYGDVIRFNDMHWSDLEDVLDIVPLANMFAKQERCPTLKEICDLVRDNPKDILVSGYVITSARTDERFVITGLKIWEVEGFLYDKYNLLDEPDIQMFNHVLSTLNISNKEAFKDVDFSIYSPTEPQKHQDFYIDFAE